MLRKYILVLPGVSLLLAVGYMVGPSPDFPPIDPYIEPLSIDLLQLEDSIAAMESKVVNLKPDNEARIIWADSIRKTEWSIVYLHGFSASQHEGNPVHREVAAHFGMNLFLSRLDGHGIGGKEALSEITPASLIETAKFAIGVGRLIGEKVIVMSCSTGGTFSIFLAAHNPELIEAQVLYSPNIEIYDPMAQLLGKPWGLQIGRAILGDYRVIEQNIGTPKEQYTTTTYRTESLVTLQRLLDETMTEEIFEQVSQPIFMGYYYKNEDEQDKVVSVEAMRDFAEKVGTPRADFHQVAFAEAGDHVICSSLHSSDYEGVRDETILFIEDVLGVSSIDQSNNGY
jgi:esterase/lipase